MERDPSTLGFKSCHTIFSFFRLWNEGLMILSNSIFSLHLVFYLFLELELGCKLIDKAWESFHDVKVSDRALIW